MSLRVSRIDMFSDWADWELEPSDVERFVGYPDVDNSHRDSGELTGFQFGKRKGARAVARIYDKVRQAHQEHIGYLPMLWGRDVQPDEVVFRVEFEALRPLLNEFGIDSPEEALAALGDLWKYLTGHWLTLRLRTDDETRSRWPLDPDWERIQRASMLQRPIGLEPMSKPHRSYTIGKRRGRDLLSRHLHCGVCSRVMSIT